MRSFLSLAKRLFRTPADSRPGAELRLAQAYQRVFLGSPDNEDQELVLVDFAEFTGFYKVTPTDVAGRDQIVFNEGMRCAFGRVFRFLRMSSDEIALLETAARETAAQRTGLASNQAED